MPRCAHCPVPDDKPCLGETEPARFGYMCEYATSGDPIKIRHIIDRSAIGLNPEPPSLAQQAVNFARAATAHALAGMPKASNEEAARRLAICRANTCGQYLPGDRCAKCGCRMEIKAAWAEQRCPLDPPLWGPVT